MLGVLPVLFTFSFSFCFVATTCHRRIDDCESPRTGQRRIRWYSDEMNNKVCKYKQTKGDKKEKL